MSSNVSNTALPFLFCFSTFARLFGCWQVLGIDVLMGCKGAYTTVKHFFIIFAQGFIINDMVCVCVTLYVPEPEKQFQLVEEHINKIQNILEFQYSEIVVMVERNL